MKMSNLYTIVKKHIISASALVVVGLISVTYPTQAKLTDPVFSGCDSIEGAFQNVFDDYLDAVLNARKIIDEAVTGPNFANPYPTY